MRNTSETKTTLTVNGREVSFNEETNLLAVLRKADIDIPTFCYHSELSVYGACRLCIVDVEGRGIVTSCSTAPEPNMRVRTDTKELRQMRKINVELLLAGHQRECPTCDKSDTCRLLEIARRLGIDEIRFKENNRQQPLDRSGVSLVRDPNKCVLCGDCVRYCGEIQDVGAIDFIGRGAKTQVAPAFNKGLGEVECVNCGQCAAVCPTGAITPRSEIEDVWEALHDPDKTVVVQLAPAVRVSAGEAFGGAPGELATGRLVAALKRLGFDQVYDTSFTADLTVIEEANEFLTRYQAGEKLPQFTSCCPAWVKFMEQYHPEMLPNLSTCRSPQQMFGSLAKRMLPERLGVEKKNLVVVSLMPCTAKKFEAKREEFWSDEMADVDHVLTTQEVTRMIKEAGIRFTNLEPRAFDMPFGFKTGAGVIFGSSGGVTEAVLRYAYEEVTGSRREEFEFHQVRGNRGLLETEVELGENKIKLAVVFGLGNARQLVERVARGEADYDFVEVMACAGGCVSGGGQPVNGEEETRERRIHGLFNADETLQLHAPQENPYVQEGYNKVLREPGSEIAHRLLHTDYTNRRPTLGLEVPEEHHPRPKEKVKIEVCVGTGCFLRGSQELYSELAAYLKETGQEEEVELCGTYCHERCDRGPVMAMAGIRPMTCRKTWMSEHGPVVSVDEELLENCDVNAAKTAIQEKLKKLN